MKKNTSKKLGKKEMQDVKGGGLATSPMGVVPYSPLRPTEKRGVVPYSPLKPAPHC